MPAVVGATAQSDVKSRSLAKAAVADFQYVFQREYPAYNRFHRLNLRACVREDRNIMPQESPAVVANAMRNWSSYLQKRISGACGAIARSHATGSR